MRPVRRSAQGDRCSRWITVRTSALVVTLVFTIPVAVLFCRHWTDAAFFLSSDASSISAPRTALAPKADIANQLPWPGQSGRAGTRTAVRTAYASAQDPFRTGATPGMMVVGDPFFEALSTGDDKGELELRGRNEGIPTFGVRGHALRTADDSAGSILREIQLRVGGSFTDFFNSTFGPTGSSGAGAASDPKGENPFAKPAEAPAGDSPAAEPKQKAAPEPESRPDAGEPAAETPAEEPSQLPVPLARTLRPDLMIRIGADGALEAMPAARLNANLYETEKLGMRWYDTLSFSNPTEVPSAITVAEFNGDGIPDICFLDPRMGALRFLTGTGEGDFKETLRIEVGAGPRSLAAGDFNGDGRTDLAVSNLGVGTLSFLYLGDGDGSPSFKSFWVDAYRDYIAATDISGSGLADVIGLNFDHAASAYDFSSDGSYASRSMGWAPSFDYQVATFNGIRVNVNAVLVGSNLALNLQDSRQQLMNVVNLQTATGAYIIVGDLNYNNTIAVAIATPRK